LAPSQQLASIPLSLLKLGTSSASHLMTKSTSRDRLRTALELGSPGTPKTITSRIGEP
jgi:hypothetical protein